MIGATVLFAFTMTRIPLPRGFRPTALASADLDADGKNDIAVAGEGTSEVIVLFGDGRGAFRSSAPVAAGAHPSAMTAARGVIVIANHETDYVTMINVNSKRGFETQTLHLHSKPHPHAVAIGDFDRDGLRDLAVDSWMENRIMLLFGRNALRGPGTPVDIGRKPYSTISAADLDGDGRIDLVAPNSGQGTVSILLGDGAGHFSHAPGSPIAAGPTPFSAAIADVNGDRRPDIVIANYSGHSSDTASDGLTWIRNDGGRRLTAMPRLAAKGDYSSRIATGDLDGDGVADVAFTNTNRSSVTIAYRMQRFEEVTVLPHPHAVAIVDGILAVTSEDADLVLLVRPRPNAR